MDPLRHGEAEEPVALLVQVGGQLGQDVREHDQLADVNGREGRLILERYLHKDAFSDHLS